MALPRRAAIAALATLRQALDEPAGHTGPRPSPQTPRRCLIRDVDHEHDAAPRSQHRRLAPRRKWRAGRRRARGTRAISGRETGGGGIENCPTSRAQHFSPVPTLERCSRAPARARLVPAAGTEPRASRSPGRSPSPSYRATSSPAGPCSISTGSSCSNSTRARPSRGPSASASARARYIGPSWVVAEEPTRVIGYQTANVNR